MEFKPKNKAVVSETCAVCGKKQLPAGLGKIFENACTCENAELSDFENIHLDHYQIVEKIGTGSITTAYKAQRQDVDGFFVVKVLREQYAENPRTAKRFKIESERACHLNHVNLAAIYEVGITKEGLPYLVTDYLEGQSVEEYLKKEGFFEEKEAMSVFLQICEGLAEAHRRGLIHRDLKPSNIILKQTESGDIAKIADFGIAKVLPNPGRETKYFTPEGEAFGDPRYMSPEQCLGQRLDARSDIYSLGCIMYKCITGKAPLSGSNQISISMKQLKEQPRPIRERFTDIEVSPGLEQVIMRALAKDADDRYQTIADLQKDLALVKEGKAPVMVPLKLKAPEPKKVNPFADKKEKGFPLMSDAEARSAAVAEEKLAIQHALASTPQELADRVVAASVQAPSSFNPRRKVLLSVAACMFVVSAMLMLLVLTKMYHREPATQESDVVTGEEVADIWTARQDQQPIIRPAPQFVQVVPPTLTDPTDPLPFEHPKTSIGSATRGALYASQKELIPALEDAAKAKVDLSEAFLPHLKVPQANLRNVRLANSTLEYANFRKTDLRGADLRNADCNSADFSGADLRNAKLDGANLTRANLTGADLSGADLSGAEVSMVQVAQTNFTDAKVTDARLKELINK